MIRAVLFDMDGTVFDSEKIYCACLAEVAKGSAMEKELAEVLLDISGRNRADIYAYLHARYGEEFPAEEIFAKRDERVMKQIDEEGVPFKRGFPEVFETLKKQGLAVALVTSTHRERVNKYLKMTSMENTFDYIKTGESVAHSKPAPDIFLLTAEAMGFTSEECVVVEDSRNGVLSGVRAGMKVVLIPDMQPVTPDLPPVLWQCIKTVESLPELIAKENR